MFMRESEGIYSFGSKKVYVRVDKDKINSKFIRPPLILNHVLILSGHIVRVGGGFLSIDEFLDQYTPAELEKIERKDPLKKFSERVAI
jgi:hypothetical protein